MAVSYPCINIITHRVVLDRTSKNMEPTAKTGNHGAISTSDSATISYYTVKLLSNKVTLHKQNRKYGKVFKAGEMLVKSE